MKNKTSNQIELELTRKLLDVVNSKEEYNWLLAEETRLSSIIFIEMKGGINR